MPENELDPNTNLPEDVESVDPLEEVNSGNQESEINKVNGGNSKKPLTAKDFLQMDGPDMSVDQVAGAHGDYGDVNVTSDRDFNEIRAQGQSFGELAAKSFMQSVGTVGGMGLEAVGFLGDIPMAVGSLAEGSELEFERNALSQAGSDFRKYMQEEFPVHKTKQAKSGEMSRFADSTYWFSHIPSIASTAAFLLPGGIGAGIGKGLASGARALGSLSKAYRVGRTADKVSASLGGALFSRHAEGMLEGFETFEKKFEEYKQVDGMTEEDAKKAASQAASSTYRHGYVNLMSDMMQWGALLRGVNFGSRAMKSSLADIGEKSSGGMLKAVSKQLKKNPDLTFKKALGKSGYSWKDWAMQGITEGMEEYNQNYIRNLSARNTDIAMGLKEGKQEGYLEGLLGEAGKQTFSDPQAWDEFIMGSLGGLLFQGVGSLTSKYQDKQDQQKYAKELQSHQARAEYVQDTLKTIQVALQKGDEVAVQEQRENLIMNLAVNGLKKSDGGFYGSAVEGNLGNTMEMFEAIQDMNAEELEALGLTEESKKEAKFVLNELEQFDSTLNDYYENTIGTGADEHIAVMKAEQHYLNDKADKRKVKLENDIAEFYNRDDIQGNLSGLEEEQKSLAKMKAKLDTKKKELKELEDATAPEDMGIAPYRIKLLKKTREENKERVQDEINELEQTMNDVREGLPQEKVNEAFKVSNQIHKEDSDINTLLKKREEQVSKSFEGTKTLMNLSDEKLQKELVDQIQSAPEKIRSKVANKLLEKQVGEQGYVNRGDKYYKIRKTDDGFEAMEVDRQLNPVESTGEKSETPNVKKASATVFDSVKNPETGKVEKRNVEEIEGTYHSEERDGELFEWIETEDLSAGGTRRVHIRTGGELERGVENIEISEEQSSSSTTSSSEETGGYKPIEEPQEFLSATPVDPDRVLTKEEAEQVRKDFDKAINEKRFRDAFNIIQDKLHKSNYSDRAVNAVNEHLSSVEDHLQTMGDVNDILKLYDDITHRLSDSGQLKRDVNKIFNSRIKELKQEKTQELKALKKAIIKKDQKASEILTDVEKVDEQIANLEEEMDAHIRNMMQELEEQGLTKYDRRTKPVREIEKYEKQMNDKLQALEERKEQLIAQMEQLERDKVNLEQIVKEVIGDSKALPSTILQKDIQDVLGAMESLRAQVALNADLTWQELEVLSERQEEIMDEVDKGIEAIKNFLGRIHDIQDASDILHNASERAYQELLDEGLLDGNELLRTELSDYIFNKFRNAFNKHVTYQLRDIDGYTHVKKLANENRLTEDFKLENEDTAAKWAAMNIDFPYKSDLFEDVRDDLRETMDALEELKAFDEQARRYQNTIDYLREAVAKWKMTPDSPGGPPNKGSSSKKEPQGNGWKNPQRVVWEMFTRPAGDSGTNSDPNDLPSQRRYFRFVNKTDFREEGYNLRIFRHGEFASLPEEDYEKAKEAGLTEEPILISAIVDENGNYFAEDGSTHEEFDPEKSIFTTMPLATLETPTSGEGRTFVATERYLNENYPKGDTLEEKRRMHEEAKQKELEKYKILREILNEEIDENGFTNREIIGKSLGVPYQKKHAYDGTTGPNNLEDVVEDTDKITISINTTDVHQHNGEIVSVREGFATITDEITGNVFEGALKRIGREERDTILALINYYVKNSTITDEGYVNPGDTQEAAYNVRDSEGNKLGRVFELIGEIVMFDEQKGDLHFVKSKKIPGGRMRVDKQVHDIFAEDPETGKKINRINPDLSEALKDYLNDRFYDIHSSKLKSDDKGYTKVRFRDGKFVTESYDSYRDWIIEDKVVGTWLIPAKENGMKIIGETAETEQEYQFFNQNVIFDNHVPVDRDPTRPKEVEEDEVTKEALKEIEIGERVFVKPNIEGARAVYGIERIEKGFKISLANPDEFEGKDLKKAKGAISVVEENILKGKDLDELVFTSDPSGVSISGKLDKIKRDAEKSGKADDVKSEAEGKGKGKSAKKSFKDRLDSSEGFKGTKRKSKEELEEDDEGGTPSVLDRLEKNSKKGPDAPFQRQSGTEIIGRQQVERIASKLSTATGLDHILLTEEESLSLLDSLYEQGEIDEQFDSNTLPHGMYRNGIIYIFNADKARADTPFHEFAHPIINQIISDNSLLFENLKREIETSEHGQEIMDRVIKDYPKPYAEGGGLKTSTWAEIIVTAIGESASKKKYQNDTGLKAAIKRIWKAIKDFFQNMFSDPIRIGELDASTTISDIADILYNGQEVKLTPGLVTQYQRSGLILEDKSVKFTQDSVDALNHMFFEFLFDKYRARVSSLFKEGKNHQLYNDIMDDVFKYFKEEAYKTYDQLGDILEDDNIAPDEIIFAGYTKEDLRGQMENLVYLVENFNEIANLHKLHLRKYDIETVTEDTLKTDTTRNTAKLWQDENIKFSAKQNATSAIRLLIGTLNSRKPNETYNFVLQNVDFGNTFNVLANHLAGTTTLEQKKDIIENIVDLEGIPDLIDRLFKKPVEAMKKLEGVESVESLEADDVQSVEGQQADDVTNVESQRIESGDMETASQLLQFNEVFSKHSNTYNIIFNDTASTFKVVDATINSGKKRIIEEWKTNVDITSDKFRIEEGRVVYNPKYFREKYPGKYNILKKMGVTMDQERLIDEADPRDRKQLRNYFKSINFLQELGIDVKTNKLPTNPERFNERAQFILQMIKSGESPDIFAPDGEAYQDIRAFAEHYAKNSPDFVENQHLNVENETVYNVVLNHYVSLMEDDINDVDNLEQLRQKHPHLFNTAYTQHSILLNRTGENDRLHNKFFDQDGKRIRDEEGGDRHKLVIDVTEGVKGKDNRVPFDELTFTDKLQLTLNSVTRNRYPLFRAGDKKLERYLNLGVPRSKDDKIGEIFSNEEIVDGKHYDLFLDYLYDELSLILEMEYSDHYLNTEKLVKNPFENSILPQLFADNSELKEMMQEAIDEQDPAIVYGNEFKRLAKNTLDDYVDDLVKRMGNFVLDHHLIEKDGKQYKNNGMLGLTPNDGIKYTEKDAYNILRRAVINRAVANIEQTKVFSAHPVYYKGSDNFFHRMSGALGTKKISSTGEWSNKILEKLFPSDHRLYAKNTPEGIVSQKNYEEGARPILRTAVFADPRVRSDYIEAIEKEGVDPKLYEDMEESDAVGLVSLDTYRDMKLRAGEWSEPLEILYKWETRDRRKRSIKHRDWATGKPRTITRKDLKNNDGSRTMFTMLKPQHFGPLAEDGFIPGMYKLAVMPVLPSYETDAMNSLRDYMNENDVGMVTFESANKVGVKNPGEQVYDKDGKPDFNNATTQDTYYDYWGIQLQTGNKMKAEVILGSQFMKQILSGIYNQGEAHEELGEHADTLTRAHRGLIERGKEDLKKELGLELKEDGNYTIDSIENLIDFLQSEAVKREANHNVIDSLMLFEKYAKSNLGLDILSNRDKVENILASIADKRVISQNVHGGAKIQAPSTFFEEGTRRYTDDGLHLKSNELKFYEDGTMEVYMPHYFKGIMRDMDVEDVQDKLLEAVAFRIPTSGLNTIDRIKIKGFLPQSAGEVIVLPSEIVAKAGSDFDVDKLNVLIPNYFTNEDGDFEYIEFIEGDTNDESVLEELYNAEYRREVQAMEEARNNLEESESEIDRWLEDKPQEFVNELMKGTGLHDQDRDDLAFELRAMGEEGLAKRIKEIPTLDEYIQENKGRDIYQLNTKEALQNKLIEASKEIISHEDNRSNLYTSIGIDILENQKDRINEMLGQDFSDVSYTDMIMDFAYNIRVTQRNIESIAGTGLSALHLSDHVHATRYNYQMNENHDIALPHNTSEDGNVSLAHQETVDGENNIGNLLNQITNMFIDGVKNPISFYLNLNLDTAPVALYLTRAGVPVDAMFSFLNQPIVRDYMRLKSIQKSFVNQLNEDQQSVMSNKDINEILADEYGKTEGNFELSQSNLDKALKGDKRMSKSNFKKFQRQILEEYKTYEQSASVLQNYVNATRIDTVAMGQNTSQLDLLLHQGEKIAKGNSGIINAEKVLTRGETTVVEESRDNVSTVKRYNISTVKKNDNQIYIFGDNLQGEGKGGQAIIRDQENAYGIPTKKKPTRDPDAYFNDNELAENIEAIDSAIEQIKTDGRNIVFPEDGLGTGLANLKEKAPDTYRYLTSRLQEEFGFDNNTGEVSPISTTQQGYQGFLAPHYEALQDFKKMFEPFFIHLSENQAQNMYSSVLEFVADKKMSMEDKVKILDKFKSDYITARVLTSEVTIDGDKVSAMGRRKELFIGDNTLPKRLNELQSESVENKVINSLMPVIGREKVNGEFYDNIKMIDQKLDTLEQNQLIAEWANLFDTHPEIAKDLVQFTMVQSGLQLSPMTFTKFIPSEIYMEMVNSAFSQKSQLNEVRFLEKFIENNYNDENLVPTVWRKGKVDKELYKRFPLKESSMGKRERIRKGIYPYQTTPEIYVPETGLEVGEYKLFTGKGRKVEVNAIKDFRNNRSWQSYGNLEIIELSDEELADLTDEQLEQFVEENNKNLKNVTEQRLHCKRRLE